MNPIHSSEARRRPTLPHWLVLLLPTTVWPILVILVHGVQPWAISRMATRFGWGEKHPGLWNWPGLTFGNYQLQKSTVLSLTNVWSVVTEARSTNNGSISVIKPVTNSHQFFRLSSF